MSANDNVKVIQSVYEAFGRGDVAAILEALTDDVDWASEAADAKGAPWYGLRRGHVGVAAFFEGFGSTMEVEEFTPVVRMLRAADLIAQWERADPRDCWRHTGEHPPRTVETPRAAAQPYQTPQSTVDAFWYVVRLDDPDYLARWLEQHPLDASALCKLWEGKNAS